MSLKEAVDDLHFEVEKGSSLMPQAYFPCVDGVNADDSMVGSHVSSLCSSKDYSSFDMNEDE